MTIPSRKESSMWLSSNPGCIPPYATFLHLARVGGGFSAMLLSITIELFYCRCSSLGSKLSVWEYFILSYINPALIVTLPPQTGRRKDIWKGMLPYYWVHHEIKETWTRMQTISSMLMCNIDIKGQQETFTFFGGETRKNYLKSVYVCVFSENILIFLERKDKAVIVKQNIHDWHENMWQAWA